MSSVKRRPGRPNRGGGKASQKSRGGGGGGGGGSRKGDVAALYEGAEAYVDVKTFEASPGADSEGQTEKYKVEMQKLHMSEQNQELIKAALLEIRGGELELREAIRMNKDRSIRDIEEKRMCRRLPRGLP